MHFVQYESETSPVFGVLHNERVYPVHAFLQRKFTDIQDFLARHRPEDLAILQSTLMDAPGEVASLPLEEVRLLPPIARPRQDILCVGVNYAAHAVEAGHALNQELAEKLSPVFFGKRAAYLLGDQGNLSPRFDLDPELDYEAELAVIIGKEGKDIPVAEALDYVFGYSVFNDFSSRQLQRRHQQWLKGKSLDGYSALGPWITTKEDFDIRKPHQVTCRVNGELRQTASTADMVTNVPEIIATLSAGMTLYPGDIIATGTPAGVAMGMDNPAWLKEGDQVQCAITDLGSLTITIGSPKRKD